MFAGENGLQGDPRLKAISDAIGVVPNFPKPGTVSGFFYFLAAQKTMFAKVFFVCVIFFFFFFVGFFFHCV